MTSTTTATAPTATATLHAHYQGWSGFVVSAPATAGDARHPACVFDPSPDHRLPGDALVIAITHGHPEHVRGALAHLRRRDRAPVAVVASRHVCRYFAARTARDDDRFLPVEPGEQFDVDGWRIRTFAWQHMTLLPPGGIGAAAAHLLRLFRHPLRLAGVALQSAAGPRHAPMLGFHVTAPGGTRLAYFGEGLHRMTTNEQLVAALGVEPVDVLVTGVEPEDVAEIPGLVWPWEVSRVVLFEPHRIWRSQFGLPQVDMPALANRLAKPRRAVLAPAPQTSFAL